MKKIILIAAMSLIAQAEINNPKICLMYMKLASNKAMESNEYLKAGMIRDNCNSAESAVYFAVKARVYCRGDKDLEQTLDKTISIYTKAKNRCI